MNVCMYVCMYVYIYIYIYMCVCVCVCCVNIYAYVCGGGGVVNVVKCTYASFTQTSC